MSGDPDLATTAKAIQTLDKLGADVIELGVPYSVSLGPQHNHLHTSMSPLCPSLQCTAKMLLY